MARRSEKKIGAEKMRYGQAGMRQTRATTMEAQSWGGAGAGAAGLRPQSKGRCKSGRCQLYKMRVLISEISNLVGEV